VSLPFALPEAKEIVVKNLGKKYLSLLGRGPN
jgi:hypothetical protein